jgi:DNA-directed RNA polymerase subunit K/omega
MDDANELSEPEPQAEPDISIDPAPPIDSRFLFVDVAGLRAKQLRRGARPRFAVDTTVVFKPERVAMEEVKRGLVSYEVPAWQPEHAEGQQG